MKPVPCQTAEEADFVKEYLLFPLMLDVLERDRNAMSEARLKMPEIYDALIGLLQDAVTLDLARVRQEMRRRGMKVYEERRTELGIEARYLCRGYHHDFSMLWSRVKAEIVEHFCHYLKIDVTKKGLFS